MTSKGTNTHEWVKELAPDLAEAPKPAEQPAAPPPAKSSAWTPVEIAKAVGFVIAMLGGAAGVERITGAGETTQRLIRESEARVTAKIEERATLETQRTDKITTRLGVVERRTDWLAGVSCAMNGAAVHPSMPCMLTATQGDPLKVAEGYPQQ
jgi:hypothetical protein